MHSTCKKSILSGVGFRNQSERNKANLSAAWGKYQGNNLTFEPLESFGEYLDLNESESREIQGESELLAPAQIGYTALNSERYDGETCRSTSGKDDGAREKHSILVLWSSMNPKAIHPCQNPIAVMLAPD